MGLQVQATSAQKHEGYAEGVEPNAAGQTPPRSSPPRSWHEHVSSWNVLSSPSGRQADDVERPSEPRPPSYPETVPEYHQNKDHMALKKGCFFVVQVRAPPWFCRFQNCLPGGEPRGLRGSRRRRSGASRADWPSTACNILQYSIV